MHDGYVVVPGNGESIAHLLLAQCATGSAPDVHDDYVGLTAGAKGSSQLGALAQLPVGTYLQPATRFTLRNLNVRWRCDNLLKDNIPLS